MQKTRNNHYVPVWYQKQFLLKKSDKLYYLNLTPDHKLDSTGKCLAVPPLRHCYPSQCFYEKDLYTTFFGRDINDEIEIKLFGMLDNIGANAVRAFIRNNIYDTKQFNDFFLYMDAQKIRTPKGLDWLKNHYFNLTQENLMQEMQAIMQRHCVLWAEAVKEIVSAECSKTKFILSDHPITSYNYAFSLESNECQYPNDPSIALKGTQTIFVLDVNHCLILTNYEYAADPDRQNATEERTNARNFRNSVVTNKVIKSRALAEEEIIKINFIIKSRTRKYIAAAQETWLYPERIGDITWADLRQVLLPPKDELSHFSGELYITYDDGSTYYQDAFGRTQPENPYLKKVYKTDSLKVNEPCGCGSGKKYKKCCKDKTIHERSSWKVLSIRERNLAFYNCINYVLGLSKGKSWESVRRELNDDQVKKVYQCFESLWPRHTDFISLLPKPDKSLRVLYTGVIDPRVIHRVISLAPYFDEIIIQNPFAHPQNLAKEYNPIDYPNQYKYQTLKNIHLFLSLIPFIEAGYINLIPDICAFDPHLHKQMFNLAKERYRSLPMKSKDIDILKELDKDDFDRLRLMRPEQVHINEIKQMFPNLPNEQIQALLKEIAKIKLNDPFCLLQNIGVGADNSQLSYINLAPNFEMSLFLAQVTGSFLLTDDSNRWAEIIESQHKTEGEIWYEWSSLSNLIDNKQLTLHSNAKANFLLRKSGKLSHFRNIMREIYIEIQSKAIPDETTLINLQNKYSDVHQLTSSKIKGEGCFMGKINCIIPKGGITHNNVQRMLVSYGIQQPFFRVPTAILIKYTTL